MVSNNRTNGRGKTTAPIKKGILKVKVEADRKKIQGQSASEVAAIKKRPKTKKELENEKMQKKISLQNKLRKMDFDFFEDEEVENKEGKEVKGGNAAKKSKLAPCYKDQPSKNLVAPVSIQKVKKLKL